MTTATFLPHAPTTEATAATNTAATNTAATTATAADPQSSRAVDAVATEPTPQQDCRRERVVVEADEIVFRAGEATITLSSSGGGVVEIHAPALRLTGDQILSEATDTNTTAGRRVVSEAVGVSELLGRLVRVDGQCVKIS